MITLDIDPHRGKPLYKQISDQITDAVLDGRLAPGDQLWSSRRIAQHYRLSYQTAERALADLAKSGMVARSVAGGTIVAPGVTSPPRERTVRHKVVTMLNCWKVFDGEHTLYTGAELIEMQAAAQELTSRLWGMLFASFPSEQFTVSHLAGWAREHSFDGVLAFGELPATAFRWLERQGYGVVVVDAEPEGSTAARVVQDNFGGIQQVVDYLASMGHRRIGYLRGTSTYHYLARQKAFESACRRLGLDADPALIVTTRTPHPTIAEAVQQLLDERPTAIVAGSDLLAAFAYKAIQELGLRIPEDVSVVGFDDEAFCRTLAPPLTTVRMPFYELGRQGARLLLDQLENVDDLPGEITVPAQLIERDSVADQRDKN